MSPHLIETLLLPPDHTVMDLMTSATMAPLISRTPSTEDLLVEELNSRARSAYQEGNYDFAVELYTVAIRASDLNKIGAHVIYGNRSAAQLQRGRAQEAMEDARLACKLNPASAKAWGRWGAAAFYCHDFPQSCHAYRRQYVLEPNSKSKKILISSICRLQNGPEGKSTSAGLQELVCCLALQDRLIALATHLQISLACTGKHIKDEARRACCNHLLPLTTASEEELRCSTCPKGMVSTCGDLDALYSHRVGAPYDQTHPLALVALALGNLCSSGSSAVILLYSKAELEALYTLARETSWCRKSQYHIAVAYRGLLKEISSGGAKELSAAINGSIYEGMELLLRNAKDHGWENELSRLQQMHSQLMKNPHHPQNQVPST